MIRFIFLEVQLMIRTSIKMSDVVRRYKYIQEDASTNKQEQQTVNNNNYNNNEVNYDSQQEVNSLVFQHKRVGINRQQLLVNTMK